MENWKKHIDKYHIDKDSKVPLYVQLESILDSMIEQKILEFNDKLPTEEELCNIFSVSRPVVRQALSGLTHSGKIYRKRSKGSYVQKDKVTQNLIKSHSFTEEVKQLGKTPSSKIIKFEIIHASEYIRNKLQIKNEKVYATSRIRLVDNVPVYYETTYLPVNKLPDFKPEYLKVDSMYNMLLKRYDIVLIRAEEYFSISKLSLEISKLLQEQKNTPAIKQERIAFDKNGVIEYTCSLLPQDKFVYKVILNY